jgi:murein DD-endopeptidase MepM/ murein hydrolase activator NlpD
MITKDLILHIQTKLSSVWRSARQPRAVLIAAATLSLVAFGAAGVAPLAPDASNLPVKVIVEELALPDLATQIDALRASQGKFISEERVRPGDSLATLLDRLGVRDDQAANFIRKDTAAQALMNLRPGHRVQAAVDAEGRLLSISSLIGDDSARRLSVERQGQSFSSKEVSAQLETRVEMRSGEIKSSLFAATDAAQVPDAVAMQMVEMFSSDIDFASDLRKGDHFQVVYETLWQDGEPVRSGRVLAAAFHNAGKNYEAVWYGKAGSTEGGFYDLQGKALKKAFLKSPLEFSRVTSGFAMRSHPISGQWKQHKGIDFAAAVGTPIRATADGVIEHAGVQGGYGQLVVVRHGAQYSTAYAHMSRIASAVKRGTHVRQGEVIGYVGTSGWSTGPHLHYEFRVNNDARDPNSIVVPQAQWLAGAALQEFSRIAGEMRRRIQLLTPTQLASR